MDPALTSSPQGSAGSGEATDSEGIEILQVAPPPKKTTRLGSSFWGGLSPYCVVGMKRDVLLLKQYVADFPPDGEGKSGPKRQWDNIFVLLNACREFIGDFVGTRVTVAALKARVDELLQDYRVEVRKEQTLTGCGSDAPTEYIRLKGERKQVSTPDRITNYHQMHLVHV